MKHYTSDHPKDTLKLALRSGIYSSVIKQCISEFERITDIYCDIEDLSEADLYNHLMNTASYSEGQYDLCMVDSSWMAEFTEKNMLTNLTELSFDLDSDVIPATKTICYQGKDLYLAPFYGNVTVLLYNKFMIREAGYKAEDIQSIEDLLKICKFQKKRHNLGFVYRGDTENNIVVDFLPILASRGAWVVDKNNRPTVNTWEFIQAMYMYKDLISTGRATGKNDLIAAIANKSAAMGIGWPGWYTPTRNSAMDYIALTGQYRSNGQKHNANIYGIWALGIPANSTKKRLARNLLIYLMDREVQKSTVPFGGVPCRYSSLGDPEILKKYPQYEAVCKALEGGLYRPVMKEWNQFYTILGKKMKKIISNEIPVVEGLEEAQQELEAMLNKSPAKN
ncbi:MAG: extracellular solute-binding protein [Treponema sp.]|nr:extracellular solute-binding protein [Treponema sp.]